MTEPRAGQGIGPAAATKAPPSPARVRRTVRRLRGALAARRPVTVRLADWETVRVSRVRGLGRHRYRLDEPGARHAVGSQTIRVVVPDAAGLVRLAVSGLLHGKVRRLRIRLAAAAWWQVTGLALPRLARGARRLAWRRRGAGLRISFAWSEPQDLATALADAVGACLRVRLWDQASGPVYQVDRQSWLAGTSPWPQGRLAGEPPPAEADDLGRPLGPYLTPPAPAAGSPALRPVLTAVANPFGRALIGAAARYRLREDAGRPVLHADDGRGAVRFDPAAGPAAPLLNPGIARYAVVSVEAAPAADAFTVEVLRTLAACGVVFAAADPAIRARLVDLDLVAVADPKEVADLAGYALSVAASRRMAIAADPALRRTALGGDGAVPLPAVSVVLSSRRADHLRVCLEHLATQTYPAWEVLVGLHGCHVPEEVRQGWHARLPVPLRVFDFNAEDTFGAVLGRLSRSADGELITKVDDDDLYGANHLTDLLLAWHTSGADVAAKGSRFVHFPERDQTIDRAWTAPEIFNVTPAGGTLLLARSTLQQFGGWSHAPKHVDTDLLIRVRSAGGLVYRTHGLEYVYVRRSEGHTWSADLEDIAAQGEQVYPGLPPEIIRPAYGD